MLAAESPDRWSICDLGRSGARRHRESMPPAHHEVAQSH
jgi:hypothetical protein